MDGEDYSSNYTGDSLNSRRYMIEREIEKEIIREEIMAEMARKQALKDEVRREILMERSFKHRLSPRKPVFGRVKMIAEIPPTKSSTERPPTSVKSKSENFSCALCQVCATSEQSLNDHIRGKKHKAKASKLKAKNQGQAQNGKEYAEETEFSK
ncbi:hypothetical protein LOK49_Contig290G00002 [Camellia lanceoleosa]|nr:hypothetical protein LOK49_Contig290G00002 [Camellia lanceoleosa]